jgi:hypothetical protein
LERSGFRARAARPFSNFLQDSGRRITRYDGDGDDSSTGGFHLFAAHDLVTGPIAAFHKNVRKQSRDDLTRRKIVKDNHRVHTLERREYFRALAFRDNRTAFAFQLPYAGVTIQPDDERVTQCARKLQAANVAGMQQVETAICENDAAVAFLAAKPQNRLLKREDRRIQEVSIEALSKSRTMRMKSLVYHAQESLGPKGRRSQ